jgi:hypothetical protein
MTMRLSRGQRRKHLTRFRAIDQTIPTLLEALRQPVESSETALRVLRDVMLVSRFSWREKKISRFLMYVCARLGRQRLRLS